MPNKLKPYGYIVEYGLSGKAFFSGEKAEMYCSIKTEEVWNAGHKNIKTVPLYTRPNQEDLAENKAGIPVKNASYWRRDSEAKEAELAGVKSELLEDIVTYRHIQTHFNIPLNNDQIITINRIRREIEHFFLSKRQGGS